MTDVTLRDANVDDLEAVAAIERVSFNNPWSLESFRSHLEAPSSLFLVAEGPGGVVGYLCAATVLDESNLHVLAVSPVHRHSGLAMRLMQHMLDRVRADHARVVHLEVRRSNLRALDLYRKFGFAEVGVRRNYYPDPVEDAVLLNLNLQQ